jgi:perosamine synthetase
MISRLRPDFNWQEISAAFSSGKDNDIELFEQSFADKMGQDYGIAFPYGRTGLICLLEALGIHGKEIICPAYTCIVVPHAITFSGNTPVFVDSQPVDFNMNLDLVLEAVTEKTGAIIATSIFGYPVDLDRLAQIREQYPSLVIIQDCAHSFAAKWRGRPVQKKGAAAIFGLNISKLASSIFGGIVTTDDVDLAKKIRNSRKTKLTPATRSKSFRRLFYLLTVYPTFWPPVYGLINWLERSNWLDYFVKYYDDSLIDMPKDYLEQFTNIEARVGLVQLEKYDKIIDHHRKMAAFYNKHLSNCPGLELPPAIAGATYSHYVVKVKNRAAVLSHALAHGIQLGWLIEYSIPDLPAYAKGQSGNFPVSSKFADETINLPLWPDKKICARVAEVCRDAVQK